MSIPQIKLDDRTAEDLVDELISRIPAHTPEWTNPRIGDPGRTLIDLFAWLADTILYRANLIPERQRLEFLRLLNIPMNAAKPAQGLLALNLSNKNQTQAIRVPLNTTVAGVVEFETRDEITVLPLDSQIYIKRKPTEIESTDLSQVVRELESIYGLPVANPYITTAYFADSMADKNGVDIVKSSVDQSAWIALLATKEDQKKSLIESLSREGNGEWLINIGFQPRNEIPEFDEEVNARLSERKIWQWQISTKYTLENGEPRYYTLDTRVDTTANFSRQGVVRLSLPDSDDWGVPSNNIDENDRAGVGDRPPRIDDPELAEKIIAWIRLKPKEPVQQFSVSWLGINAVSIDQLSTYRNIVIGSFNGASDQMFKLPANSIEENSIEIEVEEINDGFKAYKKIELLASADRDDRVYVLDAEAGTIKFGDGVTGKKPEINQRIRVVKMRAGGGSKGNLAAGNLSAISHAGVKAVQPMATTNGVDAETLSAAETRIPAYLKHGDRAVTKEDYQRLAVDTPGVEIARVEVLPRFKPQQRLTNIPGVISVMVLPKAGEHTSPNPRPDRKMLEQVHAYLEPRRPLGVELYVIGVEYVQMSVSVAIKYQDGFARDEVLQQVKNALQDYMWPLNPGGRDGQGWPLGQTISDQELEVVVARVAGVLMVNGVNLFKQIENKQWQAVQDKVTTHKKVINLELWQLPELNEVLVEEGDSPASEIDPGFDGVGTGDGGVPIPVIPETC